MKNYNWLVTACIILICLSGYAQIITKDAGYNEDNYKNLQIGYSKTTSIVFPYAVKSADKGSSDILMQKAKGAENILLLKAAKQHFPQTNLTVVTADSRLYVFVLNYDDACPDLNIKADHTAVVNNDILFSLDHENQKKIEQNATLALSKNKKISGLKREKYEMKITVNGIFILQDVLYFRLALGNASKINYDIDQLRFFIRDQKKSKRTASQEIEILPLYSTYTSSIIPDKSEVSIVYAFSKFTIPEKKYLTIQLFEKNGGRHIEINVKNTDLTHLDILNGF
ncbi:conjugative transposon protein TraN [Flavobacterium collinsii]|uniref:Type IV secretory system conjugative DNA transfer TraN family protein n=1 Tax=Flavobacterium collinsii TaxID=1114861 RepID=A0A9W4XFW0_9FLAO|nr:conjugative transposon protein TraN [Flavobacterium collinsii]CAI2768637.1 Type IV secretory system conjugative DNA transfer TraN family protein [Flavobacterium collinsii]